MIYGFDRSQLDDGELAALTREIRVRVINLSATGCLLETNASVQIGTVAVLRISFGGEEFSDAVRVIRCQSIVGAGHIYHVGTEFLSTTPPYADTLRYLMRREVNRLAGDQGEAFGLSVHTVHQYVKAIYRRFRVSSRAQLMASRLRPSGT